MGTSAKEERKRKDIDVRVAIRRSCKMPTDFLVRNRAFMGIVTNISPFGAFISSLDVFQNGETVKIVIKSKKAKIRRTGIVKWSNQMGFGLQFANATV
jgi:PilZ domain-containing protein